MECPFKNMTPARQEPVHVLINREVTSAHIHGSIFKFITYRKAKTLLRMRAIFASFSSEDVNQKGYWENQQQVWTNGV
jgi:hypothetical protein